MSGRGLFELEAHGADTFVGVGPQYPWGGLYGGQIIAQALRAAAATVDAGLEVHSLRAYFIRRGDHTEPVRYEADRIRNGRSFATRRVVARQAIGAILNLEASFQVAEPSLDLQQRHAPPGVPSPDDLIESSWSGAFQRRMVDGGPPAGVIGWMRVSGDLGDDQLLHRCWLAYLSDDLPTDAVRRAHPGFSALDKQEDSGLFSASLDHAIWFHRAVRADRWHLQVFESHNFSGGRGLAIGHIFDEDGVHVATVAQEALARGPRPG